jgi:hypothetical protein
MMEQSAALVVAAERLAQGVCGRGIEPIRSSLERKEALAHARQKTRGLTAELIGVWSSVEAGFTYLYGLPFLRLNASRHRRSD